jgi:hypothetical protein
LTHDFETPFESIESAQEFLKLLSDTVIDAKRGVAADMASATDAKHSRRIDALRLVSYNLDKLELHLKTSARILNDLRMVRRVLLEEKAALAATGSD